VKVFLKISQYPTPYNGFAFGNKWQDNGILKGFYFFEIDNYSDKFLAQQVVRLIEESGVIVIFLELQKDTNVGNIPFLLRKIVKYKKKIIVLCNGEHHQLEKLVSPFHSIKKDSELSNEYLNQLIGDKGLL